MIYAADSLPQGLFKACIVPRPIAWVSSRSKEGFLNLAPFSYFNAVADRPPMVMFATTDAHREGGAKDSQRNIEETKEFVVNIATYPLREYVNLTSADLLRQESEFDFAKIEQEPSDFVSVPRVKDSPIHLECVYHTTISLPKDNDNVVNCLVIGRVVGIHVNESVVTGGRIDIKKLQPIARLGYKDYAKISLDTFSLDRPQVKK